MTMRAKRNWISVAPGGVFVKRITYISGAMIVLSALFCLFRQTDKWLFVLQIIAAFVPYAGYPIIKESWQKGTIVFFSIWVAAYDLAYIILTLLHAGIDLFSMPFYIIVQFGIPFMVAVILKAKQLKK